MPNLLLTWYFACAAKIPPREGDLDITDALLTHFLSDLSERAIHLSGISGAWTDTFCQFLKPFDSQNLRTAAETIFLASETIYSPSSIRPFTEVLMKTLRDAEDVGGTAVALIAAKRVYFGVGGGMDEFLKILEEFQGIATPVWEPTSPGIGKAILEVVTGA